MAGRRERLRAATIEEIKTAARTLMTQEGTTDVSLRAIAREAGISAPGVYRYYESRDELLTALITDAFDDLADTLERAVKAGSEEPGEQLLAACRAYRGWALDHPQAFGLVYGDPLPGYAAPEGGQTVAAVTRVGAVFLQVYARAHTEGLLRAAPPTPPDVLERLVDQLRDVPGLGGLAPEVAWRALGAYGTLHGLVVLEVFNHLRWLGDPTDLFEAQLHTLLAELGLQATV